jgi:hypothetical protein
MPSNPFLKSVTLAAANTNYNLLTLMQARDANAPSRCSKLNIQLDPGAGGALLFVGNDDISATNYGAALYAGQVKVWETGQVNNLVLNQIYLRCATAGVQVNIDATVS